MASKRVPVQKMKKSVNDVYFESFYTLHDYKIDAAEKKNFIVKELMDDVFSFCPVCVKVGGGSPKGAALKLLDMLKALPNVYV